MPSSTTKAAGIRFEECKRLQHLPTLNLCFNLMDALLLLGHRQTLRVLLRRANLPKLMASTRIDSLALSPKLLPRMNCDSSDSALDRSA